MVEFQEKSNTYYWHIHEEDCVVQVKLRLLKTSFYKCKYYEKLRFTAKHHIMHVVFLGVYYLRDSIAFVLYKN